MLLSHLFCDFITSFLVDHDFITANERENYQYCFEYLFGTIFYIIGITLLSIVFRQFPFSVTFFLIFLPLRSLCGGYHAKKRIVCSLLSFLIYLGTNMLYIHISTYNSILWSILYILSFLFLWHNSSVTTSKDLSLQSINKLLHIKKYYLLLNLILFFAIPFLLNLKYYKMVTVCMILCAVNALVGQILVYRRRTSYDL